VLCGGVAACPVMAYVPRAVLSEIMKWELNFKSRALDQVGFGVRSFGPSLLLREKSNSLRYSVDADILTFLFEVFIAGLRLEERKKGNLLVVLSAAVRRSGF